MGRRLDLHEELVSILGTNQVYYQPPESIKLKYPAIVYSRANIKNDFANNGVYIQKTSYRVTVIDANPDSVIVEKLSKFPLFLDIRSFNKILLGSENVIFLVTKSSSKKMRSAAFKAKFRRLLFSSTFLAVRSLLILCCKSKHNAVDTMGKIIKVGKVTFLNKYMVKLPVYTKIIKVIAT